MHALWREPGSPDALEVQSTIQGNLCAIWRNPITHAISVNLTKDALQIRARARRAPCRCTRARQPSRFHTNMSDWAKRTTAIALSHQHERLGRARCPAQILGMGASRSHGNRRRASVHASRVARSAPNATSTASSDAPHHRNPLASRP